MSQYRPLLNLNLLCLSPHFSTLRNSVQSDVHPYNYLMHPFYTWSTYLSFTVICCPYCDSVTSFIILCSHYITCVYNFHVFYDISNVPVVRDFSNLLIFYFISLSDFEFFHFSVNYLHLWLVYVNLW